MPQHDLVDIGSRNAGISERLVRHLDHEALDRFGIELAEWRMRPSDDAGCHGTSPEKLPMSGDELTTKFVLDVNAYNVIEAMLGSRETKLTRPLGLEIARPAIDN